MYFLEICQCFDHQWWIYFSPQGFRIEERYLLQLRFFSQQDTLVATLAIVSYCSLLAGSLDLVMPLKITLWAHTTLHLHISVSSYEKRHLLLLPFSSLSVMAELEFQCACFPSSQPLLDLSLFPLPSFFVLALSELRQVGVTFSSPFLLDLPILFSSLLVLA